MLSLQNQNANDSNVLGILEEINSDLFESLRISPQKSIPFLVTSGGTTSRAAADKHWVLDLRKNYTNISYDSDKKQVEIEAGVRMGEMMYWCMSLAPTCNLRAAVILAKELRPLSYYPNWLRSGWGGSGEG